ncbi:MAG: diaminopimelate epimerase [Thermodesulfobacteriota bacterium]|nr:diaminopimelate epimerase [Thermodesulfobacteriota bacterium]
MKFPVSFSKMSGTGNDFIIIDHRKPFIDKANLSDFARSVCQRKISVGADGLILIEESEKADFSWTFLNGDGSIAEMCGNGARCAARFAHAKGIAPEKMHFITLAGEIEAQVTGRLVKIRLTRPIDLKLGLAVDISGSAQTVHSLNTGVPHAVIFTDNIKSAPVIEVGRTVRFHHLFQPAGTNVNFTQITGNELHVRTYERGVEDETLACGTGAVASAIVAALLRHVAPPVKVTTSGGDQLLIHFDAIGKVVNGQPEIKEVFLEGPANFIYEGRLGEEAL